MPLILVSPAYQGGHTLVVVTFDEGNPITDTTLCCNEQPGPAQALPGISALLVELGFAQSGPAAARLAPCS
jgi:phosphatidylinositol-3-phosphatase